MKRLHCVWLLVFASASACHPPKASDHASTPPDQSTLAATPSLQSKDLPSANRAHARAPKNFVEYASTPSANGGRCTVGAATDDDGMNQRPVAYVTHAESKEPLWIDEFNLPPHAFQSRVTHCTWSDRALFLLLQSDTQLEQSLSQTLLRVVKVDPASGAIQETRDIPEDGAYSAWVPEGPNRFQWNGKALVLSGAKRPHASTDVQDTFVMRVGEDLSPARKDEP